MNQSKIGLGLAALGRPDYINIRSEHDIDKSIGGFKTNAFKVLDKSYDLGLRDFDVAPSYGLGEQFLLEWNKSRDYKDINLSTKFGYTYMADWELGFTGKHEIKEHSIAKLNAQWEISKALLPNLKIYQIHSATIDSGVLTNNDVLSRLNELKEKYGLKIGISSSGVEQDKIIEKAQSINFNGKELFDSYQVTFNIFEHSCFSALQVLLTKDKTIIIKEALANGRVFKNSNFLEFKPAYSYLEQLSNKYGVGTDAIALRYIIDSLKPTTILSGASNNEQLEQNLMAFNFELTINEISKLKSFAISPKEYWEQRDKLEWN